MKYKLTVRTIWEYGQRVDSQGHPHQEDDLFPAHGQQDDSDRLFILCDGMGGHEAGEVASATVCSAMSKSIFANSPDPEGGFDDEMLSEAISDAFDALDAVSPGVGKSIKKMGTTMTLLKLHDKGCTIAHIGDSRVYHIRPGRDQEDTEILFATRDHSLVNDLIKLGEMTPEEAKTSNQRHVITRAMQPMMDRRPRADVYHTSDIRKGDYFYLCSDGMLEVMEDDNIRFIFSENRGDDDTKVNILTRATSQNKDNHTAIIVHILDVIDPIPVDKPQKEYGNEFEHTPGKDGVQKVNEETSPQEMTAIKDEKSRMWRIKDEHRGELRHGRKRMQMSSLLRKNSLLGLLCLAVISFGVFMLFPSNNKKASNNASTVEGKEMNMAEMDSLSGTVSIDEQLDTTNNMVKEGQSKFGMGHDEKPDTDSLTSNPKDRKSGWRNLESGNSGTRKMKLKKPKIER